MCELCNGTHVIHEVSSFGYRTSCCPACGPVSDEEWNARMVFLKNMVAEMKGAAANESN